MGVNISDYTREQFCVYKGRKYHVRDNGAIYRQCKADGITRKWDEEWTFGRFDPNTGYMLIGQERVHRIVCTAFHGEPVGDRNIADHIDTNRCNNRPENLRWVTKLENTLNNPITRAKIELICGSIEAFLENPKLLSGYESENPNFTWMRAVSKEEGEQSLKRWKEWAAKPVDERKPKGEDVGEWIFDKDKPVIAEKPKRRFQYAGPYRSYSEHIAAVEEMTRIELEQQYGLKDSLTPGAKQLNWKTPSEFPLCPQIISSTPLQDYLSRLSPGAIYCRNQYSESPIYDAAMAEDGSHIAVLTEIDGVTNYALSEVSFSDGVFIHKSIRTFFSEEGALKFYTLSLGREWTGGDVLEDYC